MLVNNKPTICWWLRNPAPPKGWLKPYKYWDKPPFSTDTISWCRISSIHSMLMDYTSLYHPMLILGMVYYCFNDIMSLCHVLDASLFARLPDHKNKFLVGYQTKFKSVEWYGSMLYIQWWDGHSKQPNLRYLEKDHVGGESTRWSCIKLPFAIRCTKE